MSLVRKERLYDAYCNLCFYTGQTPLSKNKWNKRSHSTPTKQNRSVEDIKIELDEIRGHS